MIIAEPQPVDASDAASTNTLVTDEPPKAPPHLMKIIYASLFVSLFTTVLSLVANLPSIPSLTAGTVIPFVFTLLHHGSTLLSNWLQRHRTESIFPFTPYSPRGIAYSAFLVFMWIVSTVVCGVSIFEARSAYHFISCDTYFPNGPSNPLVEHCRDVDPSIIQYWPSFSSMVTSSVELILITSIAVICYVHSRRRKDIPAPVSPPSSVTLSSESKVISA